MGGRWDKGAAGQERRACGAAERPILKIMDGKFYGSESFNPRLISTQIVVMQSAFYLCFISIAVSVDAVVGAPQSLSQLFNYKAYTWYSPLAFSMWVTSLVMAVTLRYVVERVKKCLDFVATYHIFHLFVTWLSTGFPSACRRR